MFSDFRVCLNFPDNQIKIFNTAFDFIKWIEQNKEDAEIFCKLNSEDEMFVDFTLSFGIYEDKAIASPEQYSFILTNFIMYELSKIIKE